MNTRALHKMYRDPAASARAAKLVYALDTEPALSRTRKGKKTFEYRDAKGRPVKAAATLSRIEALKIPPAWQNVWISTSPRSHLQATGIDAKGIKQYIYHPRWRELREILKFYRLIAFSEKLPVLRRTIRRNLRLPGLPREKVIAAVLCLMDELSIRIGNESYAEANKTYGLTTLHDKHAYVHDDIIHLHFVGKSHKEHEFTVHNERLARVVKKSQDLPGYHLFQYLDEGPQKKPVTSTEVNAFLQEIMGPDFTAKDFRTWVGTSHAYELMKAECREDCDQVEYQKKLKGVIKTVAEKLGNTAAICKAHYIHSDLQDLFEQGKLVSRLEQLTIKERPGLKRYEVELQHILFDLYEEKMKELERPA